MSIKPLIKHLSLTLLIIFFFLLTLHVGSARGRDFGCEDEDFSGCSGGGFAPLVKKGHRKVLVENEYGQISAIEICDGIKGPYNIHFFTLEPNSLLLPALLHAQMVFYVHTGSGSLSWVNEEENRSVNLKRGDIFRLDPGSVFYVQSDLETKRESLRIYAIFPNSDDEDSIEPSIGAYSTIRNLVSGFDKITLQQAFQASEELIESITSATEIQPIVHAISTEKERKKKGLWEIEARFLKAFIGGKEETMMISMNKKKKKQQETKAFNILEAKPDFENCNGRSLTVTRKKAGHLLKGTNIGLFMVNLTKGSMMGPHWNPRATEIAVVLKGEGMVRVVCSSKKSIGKSECKNMRFRVKEGDVFAVPKFHPMAQMSFNNDSFIFMGFSTARKNNHPQFLAGKQSVLQSLDRDVLALSFNVGNSTIDQLLAPQGDSIILDCTSCAEEEERMMKEEIEKEKEEEERRKREEEAKKREEEEEKRREEEEERKKREEEEARKREEEEERKRKEEEERKREEEEARKREEEEERKREEEEEEERKREEEEARKREEEEERKREEEEEKQREEDEARKREEEEARKREEEEARQKEEEEERKREEEEARQREEEKERKREEDERKREEEEEIEREQEAARREEEERHRKQEEEEARKREEEEMEREQEEAERHRKHEEKEERRQEEERQRQEEEEERERQIEEARRRQEDREKERQADRETKKQQPEKEAGREPEDHDTKTTMDKKEKQGAAGVENGKSYPKLRAV
ncbi:vicilin-like seed storage protein At2g18540 isoform X2 [Cannabis sativa]|uniref:vicilin-like seed storage protein At2g18540 isoform X2 n=1 Tax=Cannabis sativa TaxID=3483 RepID=UPI0029CA3324|nr:vicilin-like seed storage protein At2g18540 isoform X2 [Cannabis sativa]